MLNINDYVFNKFGATFNNEPSLLEAILNKIDEEYLESDIDNINYVFHLKDNVVISSYSVPIIYKNCVNMDDIELFMFSVNSTLPVVKSFNCISFNVDDIEYIDIFKE